MFLNKYKIVVSVLVLMSVFTFCSSPKQVVDPEVYVDSKAKGIDVSISAEAGKAHNHPTFVIWQENAEGEIIRTLFITKSYATGIFGHANVGDTAWLNQPGKSYQPSALPYWTHKKGLIGGKTYVPTPENPYVDAISGATPKSDFVINTRISTEKVSRIFMELNQAWDWNEYWTTTKFPGNESYKHSAQPSLIYSVTINDSDSVFYLNPIGHGDPKGESGKFFTDLSGFTTAKDIYKNIKITILK